MSVDADVLADLWRFSDSFPHAQVDHFIINVNEKAFSDHLLKVDRLFVVHVKHLAELLQSSVAVPRLRVQSYLNHQKIDCVFLRAKYHYIIRYRIYNSLVQTLQ